MVKNRKELEKELLQLWNVSEEERIKRMVASEKMLAEWQSARIYAAMETTRMLEKQEFLNPNYLEETFKPWVLAGLVSYFHNKWRSEAEKVIE